jgi:hypothetical protein
MVAVVVQLTSRQGGQAQTTAVVRSTPLAVWTTAIDDAFRALPFCTVTQKKGNVRKMPLCGQAKNFGSLGLPDSFDCLAALQPDGGLESLAELVKLAVSNHRHWVELTWERKAL